MQGYIVHNTIQELSQTIPNMALHTTAGVVSTGHKSPCPAHRVVISDSGDEISPAFSPVQRTPVCDTLSPWRNYDKSENVTFNPSHKGNAGFGSKIIVSLTYCTKYRYLQSHNGELSISHYYAKWKAIHFIYRYLQSHSGELNTLYIGTCKVI